MKLKAACKVSFGAGRFCKQLCTRKCHKGILLLKLNVYFNLVLTPIVFKVRPLN